MQDLSNIAASLRTPETWDRTKTAITITAFCNFYVGPRRSALRSWQVEQIKRRYWCSRYRNWFATHLHRHAEASNLIDFGQRLCEFCAIPFGHTPRNDKPCTFFALSTQGKHCVDTFFARVFNKCAGIYNYQVCECWIISCNQAIREQRSDNFV